MSRNEKENEQIMGNSERTNAIIEYLKKNKTATVEQLSRTLFVSPATVRRDLTEMQKLGQIERNHGGAVLVENADEISIFIRLAKNAKEKEQTATLALNHLPDFSSVFIDNSSTCLALAERMNLAHKTVVTNGLQVAMRLSQKDDVNLIMPGGEVHYNTNAVTGSMAVHSLSNFRFDLMLCSCASITDDGTYENSLETMQLKKTAFERSRRTVLLADYTKFGLPATYRTMSLSDYSLIVTNTDDIKVAKLKALGVNIINKTHI